MQGGALQGERSQRHIKTVRPAVIPHTFTHLINERKPMYIHIGSSRMLRAEDIVGIFDLDGEVTTADTKEFLKNADKRGITALAGDDLPRSFIVTASDDGEEVIFSRLTAQALAGRAEKKQRPELIPESESEPKEV